MAIWVKGAAATQADANDLVGIATAFHTDADVQDNVSHAMGYIAAYGGAEGARKLLAAGGHSVIVAALGTFSTNARVLHRACGALHYIAGSGVADAKAAICAVDGVMDKLRQASDVMRAACMGDSAVLVLGQLEEFK